jgi:protein TonB
MATATTSEFVKTSARAGAQPFSLIEQKGLAARLGEELGRAANELARDPRAFILDLFVAETKDAKRRRRIYIGLACAVVTHIALAGLMVVAGWHRMLDIEPETDDKVIMLSPIAVTPGGTPEPSKPEPARGTTGGGGGGGQQSKLPSSKGGAPQMMPLPPMVAMNAPSMPNPLLPVPSTIAGPISEPPPPDAPLGDPKGKPGEFSAGTGKGGGVGQGSGPGVGSGDGSGLGPGSGGNRSGGKAGSPDGTGSIPTEIDWRNPPKAAGYVPFSWAYKARPVVTPEAQEAKVIGTVIVRATIHTDGTVGDIEIRNPVPYMTESALNALKRSRFRPATFNGVPITVRNVLLKIEVHY